MRRQEIPYYRVRPPEGEGYDELLQAGRGTLGPGPGPGDRGKRAQPGAETLVIDGDIGYQDAVRAIPERGHGAQRLLPARRPGEGKTARPDLVVLDIMRERMTDGLDLCHEFRRGTKLRNVPILAVSAIEAKTGMKSSPGREQEYFPSDDYLTRPVPAEDLFQRVALLLGHEAGR